MPTTPARTRLLGGMAAGALGLTLSSCGTATAPAAAPAASPPTGSPAATAAPPPAAAGSTITATETEFAIALSSRDVAAGTYTLAIKDAGTATHALTIKGPGGVDQTSSTLRGAQATTLTVTLQPGTYEIYCPVGNHRAVGMATTLTVR